MLLSTYQYICLTINTNPVTNLMEFLERLHAISRSAQNPAKFLKRISTVSWYKTLAKVYYLNDWVTASRQKVKVKTEK